MKTLLLLFALFIAAAAFAQTATVIELNPADAAQAKSAYALKLEADSIWKKVDARIRATYTHSEFAPELEYTSDFRFLAPKYSNYCGNIIMGSQPWTVPSSMAPLGTVLQ